MIWASKISDTEFTSGLERLKKQRWRRCSIALVLASILAIKDPLAGGSSMPLHVHRRASASVQPRVMRKLPLDPSKSQANSLIGLCHGDSSQWELLPSAFCRDITCLWSEHTKRNIDLWLEVLKPLDWRVWSSRCPEPEGGQTTQGSSAALDAADVAFVVIMHNNPAVTAECLLELFRNAREVKSAQFILVDDGSTEDVSAAVGTGRHLKQLFKTDFLYIRNAEALGHAASSNIGMEAASAEYIALVDSEVVVHKGCLSALMATARSSSRIGMVGPLLEASNGSTAHAGSLLLSDGSTASVYGDIMNHTLHPWLNRRLKVDFLEEAFVVLHRDTALSLGGLNASYGSRYWAYTDLAMKMREADLDVVMQPLATAHYHEDDWQLQSSSTDGKAQRPPMADDMARFNARWGTVLRAKHCSSQTGKTAVQLRNRPSLLYVEQTYPQPDKDAGSSRAAELLRLLIQEGYSVTYAATAADFEYSQPLYQTHMRFMGVELLQVRLSAGTEWPLSMLIGNQSICRFDYILAARQNVAATALPIIKQSCPDTPIIFDTVDVAFLREARIAMVEQQSRMDISEAVDTGLEAAMHWLEIDTTTAADIVRAVQHSEVSVAMQTDAVIAVSEVDLQLLKRFHPQLNGHVIGLIASKSASHASCLNRHGMLFIGSFPHFPNAQAISHFLKNVLPLLRKGLPAEQMSELQLHIVGSGRPPPALHALMSEHKEHIVVHFDLSADLLGVLLARVKLLVAPLLSGGGVKGKVVMAMAHGLPVIGYHVALEGIQIASNREALLARNAADFAMKAAAAYTDCSVWSQLSRSGLQVVSEQFSDAAALQGLRRLFGSLPTPNQSRLEQPCNS